MAAQSDVSSANVIHFDLERRRGDELGFDQLLQSVVSGIEDVNRANKELEERNSQLMAALRQSDERISRLERSSASNTELVKIAFKAAAQARVLARDSEERNAKLTSALQRADAQLARFDQPAVVNPAMMKAVLQAAEQMLGQADGLHQPGREPGQKIAQLILDLRQVEEKVILFGQSASAMSELAKATLQAMAQMLYRLMELIELLQHAARKDGSGNGYTDLTAQLQALQKDAGSLLKGIENARQENLSLSPGEPGPHSDRILDTGNCSNPSPAAVVENRATGKGTPAASSSMTDNLATDPLGPEASQPSGPHHGDVHSGRRGGLLWSADTLAASFSSRSASEPPPRPEVGGVPSTAVNRSRTDSLPAMTAIDLVASPFGSFRALSDFQQAVERLNGVRSVKVRRFHQGTLHQVVQYEGVVPLEDRLAELAQFKPKVIARGRDRIEIRIALGEGRVLKASTFD